MFTRLTACRHSSWLVALIVLVGWTLPTQASASLAVLLGVHVSQQPADGHIQTLEDPEGRLTLTDILEPATRARFNDAVTGVPNFGVSGSAFWGHLRAANISATGRTWWLDHADAMVKYSDLYIVRQDGRIEHIAAGSMRPWVEKLVESTTQTFPVTLEAGESVDIFLRIESDYVLLMPLTFWEPAAFNSSRLTSQLLHGIFVGVTIAMIAYNLFVFVAVRDRSYLLYVIFLGVIFINTMGLNGTLAQCALPNSPGWVNVLFGCSYTFVLLSVSEFSHAFLGSSHLSIRIARICSAVASIASLVLYLIDFRQLWAMGTIIAGVIGSLSYMSIGLSEALRGNRAARFYSLGFGVFLVSTTLFTLAMSSVLPVNTLTYNAVEIGSGLQAILLSLALAERIRMLRVGKEQAERESARQQALSLQTVRDYSQKLEREVAARTEELIEIQQRLIATEKASALSVFTAGMAHEINNPANFSLVSLQNANAAMKRLQTFVNESLEEDADSEIRHTFDTHFEQIGTAISTAGEGFRRIHSVVLRLQSAVPEGIVGRQAHDLGDIVRTVVSVLTPSLPANITIDLDLQPSTPVICAVADMHDVLMAILLNASQAIAEAHQQDQQLAGRITITSGINGNDCVMTISDNGIGMDAKILSRAFDPFFTTKPVGSGSGLGLSRARSVVSAHGGTLTLESRPGEGTSATLCLPGFSPG